MILTCYNYPKKNESHELFLKVYEDSYCLKFEGALNKVSLICKESGDIVTQAFWGGMNIDGEFYRFRARRKGDADDLDYVFETDSTKIEIFSKYGNGAGIFGRNQLWYIAIDGRRVAALRVLSQKRGGLWNLGSISCKFMCNKHFYRTNSFNSHSVAIVWTLLHFAEHCYDS